MGGVTSRAVCCNLLAKAKCISGGISLSDIKKKEKKNQKKEKNLYTRAMKPVSLHLQEHPSEIQT